MFAVSVCFLLLSIFLKEGSGYYDVGQYIKTCDRNRPYEDDCLLEAVSMGLFAFSNGIQEWNIPPVDPYHQKELKIEYKRNQIYVKMAMKNIYVMGLKGSTVRDVRLKANEDSFHLEVDLTTPVVEISGSYIAEGRYNSLQIKANGDFNSTMTDLVYTWKLDGLPEEKDNDTYLRIHGFYMRPNVGDMKSYISNNDPDSKNLTDLGNQFANANWRALYRELLPYAQANWNKIGSKVANKLFQKIPYNELFPVKS